MEQTKSTSSKSTNESSHEGLHASSTNTDDTRTNKIRELTNASEAAMELSQSSYSGTVESSADSDIKKLKSASEAATTLSHSTYSGTVESADK